MAKNNSSGSFMLRLGDFTFAVSTASFDKLNYASDYRWVEKAAPTTTSPPLMQYNGQGTKTLSIAGTIFPQTVKNGLGQVDLMRAEAAKGIKFQLVYVKPASGNGARGHIMGNWCIYSISEERTLFTADGSPREIHFTMELKAFDGKAKFDPPKA